jgi:hypothetical protein
VSAVWLVLSLLLCGLGALVRRALRSRVADESDLFFDWWIGWALTVVFLLAWHLALAITVWTYVPIAVAGVTGASMARKDWKRALQPALQGRATLAALFVLAWLAVAALALGPDRNYDTALYHLQSVRWAQAYPVVPGLANIQSRFAMNSSFFLFGALVETVQIGGRSLRLAAGIVFLPPIVQGIVTVHAAVMRCQRKMDLLQWFQVLMIPVMLWQARQYASALSPDGVVFVLAVVVSAELLRIPCRDKQPPDGNESGMDWDYRIFGIVLLAVIGVTVKVSFAIFGAAATAVALWRWSRVPLTITGSSRQGGTSRWGLFTRISVPAIFVATLWMVHGVIMSGYIAYPSAIGSFPVDWRLPPSVVQGEADWIISWARSPGMHPREVIGNYDWLPRWLAKTSRDRDVIAVALTLALAGALRIGGRRQRQQSTDPAPPRACMFLLPSLLYVGVWFVTAPAIRFTLGPLWVIAVGTLALSAARSSHLPLDERRARIAVHGVLVFILGAACTIGLNKSPSAPSLYPVKRMTTLSGLTVYVPVAGDQCGDAPLPCSSVPPDQRLELRHPGTLANGFRIAK